MIVTSTLRMQLDAGGFVRNAAQLAEAVDKDVRRLRARVLPLVLAEPGLVDLAAHNAS